MDNPISGQGQINTSIGDSLSTSLTTPQTTSAQPFSNVKQQYKKPSKSSVLFSMYEYVKEHNKLMVDNSNPQKYKRVIQRLKQDGLIAKKGYGVWQVVKEFKQQYNTPRVSRNLRGHGFHFKLRIPVISRWNKRTEYLDNQKIVYELKNKYQRIVFRHHKVWLCDESIIIYSPKDKSYFGESAKGAQSLAIYNLEQLIIGLEHLLNCSFRIRNKYQVRISKQHYGKVKDALAQQCNKEGVKIRCSLNGEGWLEIDNSLNLNELETLHPKEAVVDMDKVVIPFFNDLKDHYQKTGESIRVSDILGMINLMAENSKSHVKLIQEMATLNHTLNNEIVKFKKINLAHLNQHQTRLNGW